MAVNGAGAASTAAYRDRPPPKTTLDVNMDDSGIEFDKQAGSSSPVYSDNNSSNLESGVAAKRSIVPTAANRRQGSGSSLLPHSLLSVPTKSTRIENQPLVDIDDESSEDEFNLPLPVLTQNALKRKNYKRVHTKEPSSNASMKELLRQDGFSVAASGGGDDSSDELDLISPKTGNRCSCFDLIGAIFNR